MHIMEQMFVVDEVNDVMEEFSEEDFDIVFDFIKDNVGCLIVYNKEVMSNKDEINRKIVSIFNRKGYSVRSLWKEDSVSEEFPEYSLTIEVV